jgi:twitching motility protein PilJ
MKFLKTLGTANTWLYILITLLLVSFILMVTTYWIVSVNRQHDEEYASHMTQLRVLTQQMTQQASVASHGKEEAFRKMTQIRTEFNNIIKILESGNPETGMYPTPESVTPVLSELTHTWKNPGGISTQIDYLLEKNRLTDGTRPDDKKNDKTVLKNDTRQQVVIALYAESDPLIQIMLDSMNETQKIVEQMLTSHATPMQVYLASRQLMLAQRISNTIEKSFKGEIENNKFPEIARQLESDIAVFSDTLSNLIDGSDQVEAIKDPIIQSALNKLNESFKQRLEKVRLFIENFEKLSQGKEALRSIGESEGKLLESIENLRKTYIKTTQERFITSLVGNILSIIVLILLVGLIALITLMNRWQEGDSKQRLAEIQRANQRNQEAILRLLSEIADLADGDLSVNATVTEDFTGAIADAINYSIEAMRELVIQINKTALQVATAAQGTRSVANQLTQASERQAQQIAKAGQAIIGMANSVKKVSANAVESADVAKKSVEIASRGAKAVQDTIAGMDTIREQIQETSKRIKRLGESSQEIGEIVGLIDDIADQTNILALNAAIQAAMAGEAGRGFAVVADEVQRLAERSGNATKQIDALVKTIQSDTNEAVSSMEQSTAGVVAGAKIAERAGEALTEIEKVSVQLAGQIENISQTSRTQAAVASNISGTMTIIQEITMQTSQGTNETAAAIERLAKLANDLKTSVAGFKLPDDVQQEITALSNALTEKNR